MNKVIFEQLSKIQDLQFNENDTYILFPRGQEQIISTDVQVGKAYLIQVENYIVNPPETFDLQSNWNKGRPIKDYLLCIQVDRIQGKMVQFSGRGYDSSISTTNDNFYEGMWVPRKSFKILEVL